MKRIGTAIFNSAQSYEPIKSYAKTKLAIVFFGRKLRAAKAV